MITCKVFFNANIGIYVENRPYEVLIYVTFRGGVKGKMLFSCLRVRHCLHTFVCRKTGACGTE